MSELRPPFIAPLTYRNLTIEFFFTVWLSRTTNHPSGIDKAISFRLNNRTYTMGLEVLRPSFGVAESDPLVPLAYRETNVNTCHF